MSFVCLPFVLFVPRGNRLPSLRLIAFGVRAVSDCKCRLFEICIYEPCMSVVFVAVASYTW